MIISPLVLNKSVKIGGNKMKNFKSPIYQLAQFFKKSRDQWRQRAIEKQKKIRALLVKVRDLSNSRDKWKQKAKELEQKLRQVVTENNVGAKTDEIICPKLAPIIGNTALLPPVGHVYPLYIIQIAIQLYIYSLTSFRGAEKTFEIFSQIFEISNPSFDSIRMWIYRVGLYELQREHEFRTDWIFILDHTIELGQIKCLVILGVPVAHLKDIGYTLKHQDVEVLDIEIMEHSTGEMIHNTLVRLSERVGTPIQIISDHGPDLQKGIILFVEENTHVVYTYDITHKMALLLKKELEHDEKYNEFVNHISISLRQIQQTELYFLAPPKQRVKARYLNIDKYVEWAVQVLEYKRRGDFSQIRDSKTSKKKYFKKLKSTINSATSFLLSRGDTKSNGYADNQVLQSIKKEVSEQSPHTIPQVNDRARNRFMEKLGWLLEYEKEIKVWSEIVHLILLVEKQVKCEGLSQKSTQVFQENSKDIGIDNERVQNFRKQIIEYLSEEAAKIPNNQTLIGTSDIIESTFGKYKNFSSKSPLKEVGKLILTIPVFIGKKTTTYVKTALETVTNVSVIKWAKEVFGQSNLSKRINAFKT